jgi:HamA
MDATQPMGDMAELIVLREKTGARASAEAAVDAAVKDHLVGLDILARIGTYKQAIAHIRNKLPGSKQVRSGDFGEILASEYLDQFTEYRVPVKKLRWKDDRAVAMRGNDVIGIRKHGGRWYLLKGESKSRAALGDGAVEEAVEGLHKHTGRPNPSSLAFISSRLHDLGRDDEAAVFDELQSRTLRLDEIEHMVFTLSGNDPTSHLSKHPAPKRSRVRRHLVGCMIADHQKFITETFDRIHAGKPSGHRRTS